MGFELPDLPYAHDALEPHIDARTMEIHHGKHHNAYTTNLNNAVEGSDLKGQSIEDILKGVSGHSGAVRNNGGGFYNHGLFWQVMSPDGGGEPSGELAEAIDSAFGSFDEFKTEFANAAATSSCVLKGLHPVIATSAPPATKVLTKTAVSFVTCKASPTFIPFKGFSFLKRSLTLSKAPICISAHSIFFFPCSASFMSFTS